MLPKKLKVKLKQRIDDNSLRTLSDLQPQIDFYSNDYLGFSSNKTIFKNATEILRSKHLELNGSTGSRLLSGNHKLYNETEKQIAAFHNFESALLFNSGYDANLGFFSSIPQRGDIILYDELCHASIRDGIKLSNAKAYKFAHNNLKNITALISKHKLKKEINDEIFLITESVFSMDGDQPDLAELATICKANNVNLIIDEAHALGVIGKNGEGLVHSLNLQNQVFATIITFGKALGCHGAAILGSTLLKSYLVNFSRSFIYTTGLPPHSIATIQSAYRELKYNNQSRINLKSNIAILKKCIDENEIQAHFVSSFSAINCCIIPGNNQVKHISENLKKEGFNVKPILSPTVPKGKERLRICLHSFNTKNQIERLVEIINANIS